MDSQSIMCSINEQSMSISYSVDVVPEVEWKTYRSLFQNYSNESNVIVPGDKHIKTDTSVGNTLNMTCYS